MAKQAIVPGDHRIRMGIDVYDEVISSLNKS